MSCLLRWLVPFFLVTNAANRNKYRRCANSPFCKRYSDFVSQSTNPDSRVPWSLSTFDESTLSFTLITPCTNCNAQPLLRGQLDIYTPGVARITLDDGDDRRFRKAAEHGFENLELKKMEKSDIEIKHVTNERIVVEWTNTETKLRPQLSMYKHPWRVEMHINGVLTTSLNDNSRLNFELFRTKEEQKAITDAHVDATYLSPESDLWETWFDGQTDTSRWGPQAIGVDVRQRNVLTTHGMAEHALRWNLPMSDQHPSPYDINEPMRFWNSDIPEFELNSPMALYASIPLLFSVHEALEGKPNIVSGLLWVNAAETFVNMKKSEENNLLESWWASETGILDVFLFSATDIQTITLQYNHLTGHPPMQMQNTLGFHQCRWNYESQDDLLSVADRYDALGIPFDYLWLDIDHSDNRKYFTWNSRFPEPQKMLDALAAAKHNLVVIVDPHVKAEDKYSVYDQMKRGDFFVKEASGDDFRGWCWPGDSRYPDVLDPAVRQAYHALFHPNHWKGTAPSPVGPFLPNKALATEMAKYHRLQLWNDMNEPSVFNKPEVTIPRSTVHRDGMEHRAVHALYSISFHRATYESMRSRDGLRRPFVLTRGAFIGSHRYGSIWTGDIVSSWEQLHFSIPMILHLASCGLSLAGADIGGFVGNPDQLLLTRWFQLGIWYPFMRLHSTLATRRREVYLASEEARADIHQAILLRYRLIPFWYTLTHQYATQGRPMLSSLGDFNLRYHGIVDLESLSEDKQFLVGDTFWVKPVLEASVTATSIRFPGSKAQVWYDLETGTVKGQGSTVQALTPDSREAQTGLVYVRGGTIVYTKERHRRSVDAQRYDPFTLSIYPDVARHAQGYLWLDDNMSDSGIGCLVRATFEPKDQGYELRISHDESKQASVCPTNVGSELERLRIYGLGYLNATSFSRKSIYKRDVASTEVKLVDRIDLVAGGVTSVIFTKAII